MKKSTLVKEKICSGCGETKPLSGFYRDKNTFLGVTCRCISCLKPQALGYYYKNKPKVFERQYARYKKARIEKTPLYDRLRARASVRDGLANGKLKKLPCESCGANENIQAHHHAGYDKENWRNVTWLCSDCHWEEHAC